MNNPDDGLTKDWLTIANDERLVHHANIKARVHGLAYEQVQHLAPDLSAVKAKREDRLELTKYRIHGASLQVEIFNVGGTEGADRRDVLAVCPVVNEALHERMGKKYGNDGGRVLTCISRTCRPLLVGTRLRG